MGFGNVGSGAYQVLEENAEAIALKAGSRLEVAKVADIDWGRPRAVDVPQDKRTTDARAVIADPAIDIIVETIGGTDPALDFVLSSLRAGKCVVTSNKELIAKHGREILEEADARGLDICFEGAVGGGIPIVPDPGDTVMYRMVVQTPKIVCDTCTIDPELILENHWTTTVKKV